MPRNLHLNRWNAKGCHGEKKTKSFLTCPFANRLRSARLIISYNLKKCYRRFNIIIRVYGTKYWLVSPIFSRLFLHKKANLWSYWDLCNDYFELAYENDIIKLRHLPELITILKQNKKRSFLSDKTFSTTKRNNSLGLTKFSCSIWFFICEAP